MVADEENLSEGTSQNPVLQSSDERDSEQSLGGGSAESQRTGGNSREADGRESGTDGADESGRYDEVGSPDEQHQELGTGNREESGNIRLEYYDRNHEDKSLPFFGGDDTIREILGTTPHLSASKEEIKDFYERNTDNATRTEYIKGIFNNDYTQYVTNTLSFDEIQQAAREYDSAENFFDYLGSIANQELADVGTEWFEEAESQFSQQPDFTDCTKATMQSLVAAVSEVPVYDRETEILYSVLGRLKIDDIELGYDENGLVARDGDNEWHGAEFYHFLVDEAFVFEDDGSVLGIDTLTDRQTYEVIAVFKTVVYTDSPESFKYYQFINAETNEDFTAYVEKCKKLSLYETGVTAEYGDKLLTLSTCEYSRTNGRLVVVAKLINE